MDKEVVRNLCRFMALRHETEVGNIRIGSNQKTRQGSATMYKSMFTGEINKLNLSISTYNTDTGSKYWDTRNKVSILDTIIHEFAHLEDFKDGWNNRHGSTWLKIYHKFIVEDWKELVSTYNLLAVDNLPDSWELLIKYNEDSYFNADMLLRLLEGKDCVSFTYIVSDIIAEKGDAWLIALNEITKLGMVIEFGDKKLVVKKDNQHVADLVKVNGILKISQ